MRPQPGANNFYMDPKKRLCLFSIYAVSVGAGIAVLVDPDTKTTYWVSVQVLCVLTVGSYSIAALTAFVGMWRPSESEWIPPTRRRRAPTDASTALPRLDDPLRQLFFRLRYLPTHV